MRSKFQSSNHQSATTTTTTTKEEKRMTGHEMNGFWGKRDAIQDWCEPNYVITIYIAEFFNTISSLPMIFLGVIGIYYTRNIAKLSNEHRYTLCFIGLSVVGVGSTLFHGTLRWHFQLADEIPMLVCNWIILYIIIQNKSKPNAPPNWPIIILFSIILLITCIGYAVFKIWYLFIGNYGFGMLLQWILAWPWFSEGVYLRSIVIMLCCYYGGFVFWMIDLTNCALVQPYHFHAIWHIAAGYGTYLWMLILVMMRVKALKKKNLRLDFQRCPYVIHSIQETKKHRT